MVGHSKNKTLLRFAVESFSVVLTVILLIHLADRRRIFAGDESNNHTGKRWEYLYRLARSNTPVDVLILGNSHAYTGLLPMELSRSLGKTCFLLASQGNFLTDGYYMLKEAMTIVRPKLVIIETYMIREYEQ